MTENALFDAVLFDMDGTLVDSTAIVERIWTAFAERHHLDPRDVLRFAHGRPTSMTVQHFLDSARLIADEIALVAADEATDTTGVREVPGARAMLEALQPQTWAVVTSATPHITHLRMAAAGLPTPPLLITAEDVVQGKPSPEGYLLAATRLGVDITRCLVFEDAGPGIAAAVASGGTVVVVGDHRGDESVGLQRIPHFEGASLRDGAFRVDASVPR